MSHPPPRRRPILARTLVGLLAGLGLLVPHQTASAEPRPPAKIDKAVLTDLKDGKATFMVRLKGEADITAARKATTKAAKGKAVYDAQTAFAKKSQATLRKLLTERKAEHTPFWISNTVKVTADPKLAADIAALPEVTAIEPVGRAAIPKPVPDKARPQKKTANAVEWNIDRINAPRVWNEQNNRGEGIVVAILDSGVESEHPALAGQYRGRHSDGRVDHDYNWFDPDQVCPRSRPCDRTSHGTHVAGIIVGQDGIGVAPGARWIAVRGCDNNICEEDTLLASGEWLIAPTDLNGQNPRFDLAPDIVNNSWINPTRYDDWYRDIVRRWVAAGIFPMFASGNAGSACDTIYTPGLYPESYSAGALEDNDSIWGRSSRGSDKYTEIKPNISAPGSRVRSAVPAGYTVTSGTSQASPHVAGAVALMWSAAPALRGDVAATRQALDGTAHDVSDTRCGGTPADNNVYGEGRLDAYAAVQAAPAEPLGGLTGTVTANGAALPGSEVTVNGPTRRTVAVAENGAYSMLRLPPGVYQVTASRFGYDTSAATTVTVTDGQTATADATLTKRPTAVITGSITRGDGPEERATVTATGTPVKAVTDASGHYEMTLPHGSYRLEVAGDSLCVGTAAAQVTVAGNVTKDFGLSVRRDDFGYSCAGGREPFAAGTERLALTGSYAIEEVALPFPVPFYGDAYSQVWVSTDGYATFAEPDPPQENGPLPSADVNVAVFPFWDDLIMPADAGVYTATVGTAPHRSFVIEWRDAAIPQQGEPRVTFSVLLGEDGTIGYRYKDVDNAFDQGLDATIGIQNTGTTDALQYSYNTPSIKNDQSLTFTAADYGVVRGTVTDANDDEPVANATVEFPDVATYTTGADGVFTGQIRAGAHNAKVNAPNYGTTYKDVTVTHGAITTMNTELITGKIIATPAELNLTGGTTTATITLTNQGWPTPYEATSDSAWLTVTPASGGLVKDQTATLTVTATGGETERSGKITINSTSGRKPVIEIPVTITQ
ncbi:S8 family serine peptidase [Spongiactinospora sp. TRM90649]|uniref:S8 family serine peptidase n=1 Tax=Spongiactinospora sp. TRM90649 TaxID=3031114 RepID=UPI0023F7144A|nr:S8 family serine peptidase [Spongiactinospora sp. TRM90649]MDF5753856.1 S8 family serine peptidase [Spongiactinospora sp. TRM90649]